MARPIMIQGTASNAGKSVVATALCRIFRQDGSSVAPFKSQNMALNSFITRENLEMGRAQVAQAEAAGLEPSVLMNPILLKPTGEAVSQVIVDGEVVADLPAAEYFRRKSEFLPAVRRAYQALAARHDIVVIEGAGSPAEINLKENDIVNMGMAALADAPVLLIGDIDRGGVFASLYGTVALLEPEERARIRGFVINKFRGDVNLLRPGLAELYELTGIPVLGVIPWTPLDLDDEDSLAERLGGAATGAAKPLDAAVIRLPRLSNFTDFNALDRHPHFAVRYVDSARRLGRPDLVILPGSKNTVADLAWLRESGLEAAVKHLAAAGTLVMGICGGYQMLGMRVGAMRGLELLPVTTVFGEAKTRTRTAGRVADLAGPFALLSGAALEGYEIHMGRSVRAAGAAHFADLDAGADGAVRGPVLGTYLHGLFDSGAVADRLAAALLADRGGAAGKAVGHAAHKEAEYDRLADVVRRAVDMRAVYDIIFKR